MELEVENLPRISSHSIDGFLFCAKGPFVERYRYEHGSIIFDRKFGPIDKNSMEIAQIAGSSKTENLIFICNRTVYWIPMVQALTDGTVQAIKISKSGRRCRIMHIRIFRDERLLIIYADSTMDLLNGRNLEETLLSFAPRNRQQIMGASSDGETFDECRVLLHTYLGSMIFLQPGKSDASQITLDGNPGMAFDSLIDNGFAFSVHDDRSLRVWDLQNFESSESTSHEYGHMARPFTLCYVGRTDTIYTGANDEKILRWKWNVNERKLSVTGTVSMPIGSIRKILLWRKRLIVSSEAGFLVAINEKAFDLPQTKSCQCDGISSIRSCYSLPNMTILIDDQGRLFKEITSVRAREETLVFEDERLKMRFLTASTSNKSPGDMAIAWGDQGIVDAESSTIIYSSANDEDGRLISVVRWERLLLATTSQDKLLLVPLDRNVPSPSPACIDLHDLRLKVSKKRPFIINCAVCLKTGNRIHCIFGCMSSHLVLATFDSSFQLFGDPVFLAATEVFNRESVQDLWVKDGHLYALGKCGYMFIWDLDQSTDELQLNFLQKSAVGMEWPCRFLETRDNGIHKRLVFGFSSTLAVLFDLSTKNRVWEAECGGGNRHWNVSIDRDRIFFEYIKNEQRFAVTSEIHYAQFLDRPLHIGKVIFCEMIEYKNAIYTLSAGADNRLVLSRLTKHGEIITSCERFESEEFSSISMTRLASNLFRVFCGLAKGRVQIVHVDLDQQDLNNEFLPSSLRPIKTLTSVELAATGRLRVASEPIDPSTDELIFAVGDDGSDKAKALNSRDLTTICSIVSQDRAVFSKLALVNGILLGASTNGRLYASKKDLGHSSLELCRCGLSAISALSFNDTRLESVYLALGDEAGSIHLIRVHEAVNSLNLERIATYDYVHASTVTGVLLYSIQPLRIFSVALDCRVALLELRDDKLIKINVAESMVQDPGGLCVRGSENNYLVTVYGHGVQSIIIKR